MGDTIRCAVLCSQPVISEHESDRSISSLELIKVIWWERFVSKARGKTQLTGWLRTNQCVSQSVSQSVRSVGKSSINQSIDEVLPLSLFPLLSMCLYHLKRFILRVFDRRLLCHTTTCVDPRNECMFGDIPANRLSSLRADRACSQTTWRKWKVLHVYLHHSMRQDSIWYAKKRRRRRRSYWK